MIARDAIRYLIKSAGLLLFILGASIAHCGAQSPPPASAAQPSAQTAPQATAQTSAQASQLLSILRLDIDGIEPMPLAAGQGAVIQLIVRFASAQPVERARQDLGEQLRMAVVTIDGNFVAQNALIQGLQNTSAAKITSDSKSPETKVPEVYQAGVSINFTLDRRDLNKTLWGMRLAPSHILTVSVGSIGAQKLISVDDSIDYVVIYWATLILAALLLLGALVLALRPLVTRIMWRFREVVAPPSSTSDGPSAVTGGTSSFVPHVETTEGEAQSTSSTIPPPSVPELLVAALNEGRAVLALGSGASVRSGYPSSRQLVRGLVNQFGSALTPSVSQTLARAAEDEALASQLGGFGKIMDILVAGVGREKVLPAIARELAVERPDPSFHRSLSELPWHALLSLTWDEFAERIFAGAWQDLAWKPFTPDAAGDFPAAIRAGDRLILKALGDLDRPTSLSLSIEEFRRNLGKAPDFQRGIALLLQTCNFLFIGVGPETLEQFLQAATPDLEVGTARHFALVPDRTTNDVWSSTLSRFGVQLLPYAPIDDHQAVAEFVESLKYDWRRYARANRPSPSKSTASRVTANRITRLKLVNIGPFDSLELTFPETPIAATGLLPWTVVFGPNGCGKSSILKAIGLVLAGNDPKGLVAARRLLKAGTSEGSIELNLGSQVLRTILTLDRREVVVKSVQVTQVQAGTALVLGFPALRGAPSKNPTGPSSVDGRDPEPADLLPLVNAEVDLRLASFKQWIVNLLEQAGKGNARAKARQKLIDGIIRDLVPGKVNALAPLDDTYVIRVETPEGKVPFDDLSQGMASIFNWVGVLAQRLYDVHPDYEQPENEAAVVLIDEVDAHLHPEWQRKLVELTKKFFPKVQIIASSHSPLLAGALRAEELCVLQRVENDHVSVVPYKIDLFGQRSDDILTSPIFGLHTDRNPEAERMIHQYFDLFEKSQPSEQDKQKLAEMGEVLKRLNYGQAIPAVSPELSAADLGGLTPEQTDTLRRHFAGGPGTSSPPQGAAS